MDHDSGRAGPVDESALVALRRDIDDIDDRLHDLIMARMALAGRVSAVKGDGPLVRPGREMAILRRLAARHRGPLPFAVVARIWREIIGAMTRIEGAMAGVVFGDAATRDVAAAHFGSIVPLTAVASAEAALAACRGRPNTLAVLPWPTGEDVWWLFLAFGPDDQLRVAAKLPLVGDGSAPSSALVGALPTSLTDQDRALVVVGPGVDPEALPAMIAGAGLDAQILSAHRGHALLDLPHRPLGDGLATPGITLPTKLIGGYAPPIRSETP